MNPNASPHRTPADPAAVARSVRKQFATELDGTIVKLAATVQGRLTALCEEPAGTVREQHQRRDALLDYRKRRDAWMQSLASAWRTAAGGLEEAPALQRVSPATEFADIGGGLTLLSDDEVDRRIRVSRLVSVIEDRAGAGYSELRLRIKYLEDGREPAEDDVLHPSRFAQLLVQQWGASGLGADIWALVHDTIAALLAERYEHAVAHANQTLIDAGVLPVIDHRVRRAIGAAAARASAPMPLSEARATGASTGGALADPAGGSTGGWGASGGGAAASGPGRGPGGGRPGSRPSMGPDSGPHSGPSPYGGHGGRSGGSSAPSTGGGRSSLGGVGAEGFGSSGGRAAAPGGGFAGAQGGAGASGRSGRGSAPSGATEGYSGSVPQRFDDTHLMTATSPLARARAKAQGVLGQIKRLLVARGAQFDATQPAGASPQLTRALDEAVATERLQALGGPWEAAGAAPAGREEVQRVGQVLREQTAAVKREAATDVERATIEVVALMFQAILAEERIAPSLRVWFARLQMPVLRVALAEPDFFSSLEHPARQLIDRMGAVVLGFDASGVQGPVMEAEVRRIVQVIEQYPETGRRVFRIVLDEFKQFLARFLTEREGTQRLVSVAQQVEQKETLTIQYTIELRKMLGTLEVGNDLRDFLFKVWAEVLALSDLRHGAQHPSTQQFKRAAPELLWAATAKATREERAEVLRHLPALLQRLREGMTLIGLPRPEQDAHIKRLNQQLTQAFLARGEGAAIASEQIDDMARRLDALEAEISGEQVGQSLLTPEAVARLLGPDAGAFEVLADTGPAPTVQATPWVDELELGQWFQLDHNHRYARVQLVWRNPRGRLFVFSSGEGANYLIQRGRLANYLKAGLLLPEEDETLTIRATRAALTKLEANPERIGG